MLSLHSRRLFSSFRTLKNQVPPTHFSDSNPTRYTPPKTHFHDQHIESKQLPEDSSHNTNEKPIKELTVLLTMVTLSFFAIDNYLNRIKAEKHVNETVMINLNTLKSQQVNFNNLNKRKNLQILAERKENNKKLAKMAVHIALLRKQLKEAGHDPVSIEYVLQQFDTQVNVSTSITNVTDQVHYVKDTSGE
ncbi:hypothetical protein CAAN3_15S02916 [[Candida] anglica]